MRPSWRSWIIRDSSVSLRVDLHVVHGAEAVEHGLRKRGMRMHGEHQVLDRALELHHRHALGDQLSREWPDDVHAQDLAELRVADDLHKSVVRADDGRARISREGEL